MAPKVAFAKRVNRRQTRQRKAAHAAHRFSPFFEIALVLPCLDHVSRMIVNSNHGIMRPTAKHRVSYRVIRLGVPEPTKGQRIGNQIDAAFIFARVNFVNARGGKLAGVFLERSVS